MLSLTAGTSIASLSTIYSQTTASFLDDHQSSSADVPLTEDFCDVYLAMLDDVCRQQRLQLSTISNKDCHVELFVNSCFYNVLTNSASPTEDDDFHPESFPADPQL
jgi:6-pyruvoyl-tetrahydropterin synthase